MLLAAAGVLLRSHLINRLLLDPKLTNPDPEPPIQLVLLLDDCPIISSQAPKLSYVCDSKNNHNIRLFVPCKHNTTFHQHMRTHILHCSTPLSPFQFDMLYNQSGFLLGKAAIIPNITICVFICCCCLPVSYVSPIIMP